MAEIYLNVNDLESIVKSYHDVNENFVFRSFSGKDARKRFIGFIDGKECTIDFFFKTNGTIKIMPTGKNIETSNILIEYIKGTSFDANVKTEQCVFYFTNEMLNSLIQHINEEFFSIIDVQKDNDIVHFNGYHNDNLVLHFYPTTNKAMLQGKHLPTFNIIVTYLSLMTDIPLETIVEINNKFNNLSISVDSIRSNMKNTLGDVYEYLDEALLKSLSGSFSLLENEYPCEDYSGCLTGVFKTLEGYLTKILINVHNYKITSYPKFSMFHKNNYLSDIDKNNNISSDAKKHLNKLYRLYNNKRNVFLHATIDPSTTRVIGLHSEAKSITDDILKAISESYNFYKSII